MILFSELLAGLSVHNLSPFRLECGKNELYYQVERFAPEAAARENVLYMATTAELEGFPQEALRAAGFLVSGSATGRLSGSGADWAAFSASSPEELLAAARTVLGEHARIALCKMKFGNALLAGEGLRGILQIAARLAGNPVYFQDPSSKLVEASDMELLKRLDDTALKTLGSGFAPAETFARYHYGSILSDIAASEAPFLVATGYASEHRRIVTRVMVEKRFAGHLTLIETDREFDASDTELIRQLAAAVAVELRGRQGGQPAASGHQSVLRDLLEGHFETEAAFQKRAATLDWSLGDRLYCVAVRPDDPAKLDDCRANASLQPILTYLAQMFHNQKLLSYEGGIFLLFDLADRDELTRDERILCDFMPGNNLIAGISGGFSRPLETPSRYREAIESIRLGFRLKVDRPLFRYWDLSVYALLAHVEKDKNLTDFCPPEILEVIRQDSQNNTAYFKTACEYLLNRRSITATAQKLFIHKNTVAYRVARFGQQTGMDLSDPENSFRLILAKKILDMSWINIKLK